MSRPSLFCWRDSGIANNSDREPSLSESQVASLETPVRHGIIPMEIAQDGNVLHPDSWQLFNLQAIQEQTSGHSSTADYIGRHMEFQHDAVTAQDQLQVMSPNGAAEQLTNTDMQASSVGLRAGSGLAHFEESHPQPLDHLALAGTTDTTSDGDFNEEDYLNDDPVSEQDAPGDEGCDEIQCVEVDSSTVQTPSQRGDCAVQVAQDNSGTRPVDPEDYVAPGSSNTPEPYTSSAPLSSATTTSADTDDQPEVHNAVITAQSDAELSRPSIVGSDILSDTSKACDLIKALENKGALAGLLEALGYQKSSRSDVPTGTAPSVRSVVSDNTQIICEEPNCGKGFQRQCELK